MPGLACAAEVPLVDHFESKSNLLPSLPASVFRFDLDVTGDGVPEIFLSQSQTSGMSGLEEWLVYTRVDASKYRLLGILSFSYSLFRLSDDSTRLLAFYASKTGAGSAVTFSVDADGFHEESTKENTSTNDDLLKEYSDWRKKVGLRVVVTDIAPLEAGQPVWRLIGTTEVVQGVSSLAGLVVVE